MCEQWDKATHRGAFRYTLDGVSTRHLSGTHGLVVQRNPKRFSHRRKPADMQSIVQPFDHEQFNFNKISKSEACASMLRVRVHAQEHIVQRRIKFLCCSFNKKVTGFNRMLNQGGSEVFV